MEQSQIDAIKAEINAVVGAGSTIAATVAPEYLPAILIGKAVMAQVPGLFEDVVKLIQKNEPTDADAQALAVGIHGLLNPETL